MKKGFLDGDCVSAIRERGGCLIAVSGGADSVALLQALTGWAREEDPGPRIEVVHVHHGLRGEDADEDARFVEQMCRRLKVPFHLRTIAPLSARRKGATVEEFLRSERYACFEQVLAETGLGVLALGHTADDLAETFLMHLMRGAGLGGLSFRPVEDWRGGAALARPLWRTGRTEVESWLARRGVGFREDATNASPEFTRNRVRALLIPMMEKEFNASVRRALGRSADQLSAAEDCLRSLTAERLAALTRESGTVRALPRAGFLELHPYLQAETAREWIRAATEGAVRPGSGPTGSIRRIALKGHGRVDLAAGLAAVAEGERLLLVEVEAGAGEDGGVDGRAQAIRRELAGRLLAADRTLPLAELPAAGVAADLPATADGVATEIELLDGGRLAVQVRWSAEAGPEDRPGRIVLRNRRPGDRLSPSVKLKSVLIDDKVPAAARDRLILIATPDGRTLHVVGMERINARLRMQNAASRGLIVETEHRRGNGGRSAVLQ